MIFGSIISYRTPVPKYGWKFWKRFTNYQWLQMTFTGRPETHAAIYVGHLHRLDTEIVYDAGLSVRFDYWGFQQDKHTVFSFNAPEKILKEVIYSLIKDYNATVYGVPQLFYFLIRWALFFIDTRRWWIPLKTGKICSELVYEYMYRVARRMQWHDLRKYLDEWLPDNFHAGDVRQVLDKFTGIYFTKIRGN